MQKLLSNFIVALRHSGLPISQAETLDALRAVQLAGLSERQQLKTTLSLTLAKTHSNQLVLEDLFDQYFVDSVSAEPGDSGQESDTESNDSLENASKPSPGEELGFAEANPPNFESALARQLMGGDSESIALAIAAAGQDENLSDIHVFTQKNLFSYRIMQRLGDEALLADINRMEPGQQASKDALKNARAGLQEQVRDHVEQQYLVHAKNKGLKFRDSVLQNIKLSNIEYHDYQRMAELVHKAARKLASQHSRRRRTTKRGMLDVRRTIAANAAFDGVQFNTRWKATRIDRPKIVAICDVSGSVSRVARFLLLFLYSLQDVFPKVRSFVFASDMVEVSAMFDEKPVAEAVAEILNSQGNMSSGYGTALEDFKTQALRQIDKKTTVIMLGDARNNGGDGRSDIWQQVYRQSRRVLWLNPESELSWNTGDSIMSAYAPYCSQVDTCQTLNDVNRILSRLLKYS